MCRFSQKLSLARSDTDIMIIGWRDDAQRIIAPGIVTVRPEDGV